MSQVEQFGKYILLEKLAAGGMAEVYLAKSTGASGVNKFLAIKRILPQYSENIEFIEMFKEEAKIAVNLNHSNVVSIFDFGIEREQFFLVMEYVEGRNLRQIVNELKKNGYQFTTEQIVYMIKEVAAGLDHAHRCIDGSTGRPLNITHRDMSPQNIMISFEGEVKIIDFGIAKAETQLEATKAGTLKGKFGYMSPEQAEGYQVDLRTDIFSLGIVLWELLANDRLFTASSEAAILRKIRDCQIPSIRKINPSIQPELERIVNKALAKDKSLRYQTSAAMHRDLNRFLNTQYPEFTPHDFSVSVKNIFALSYQEQKRKLVEYAKIQAEPVNEFTKTEEMRAVTKTAQIETTETFAPPEAFHLESSEKVSLPVLKENNPNVARPMPSSNSGTTSFSGANSAIPAHSFKKTRVNVPSRNSDFDMQKMTSVGIRVASVLLVLGGIYFFLKSAPSQYFSLAHWQSAITNILSPKKLEGVADIPSKAKPNVDYFVSVRSNPLGAEIKIDGVSVNLFTPAQVKVPGNKTFHLTLQKDKFLTYEQDVKVEKDAAILNATLQPLPKAGYVSINLVAGGENPVIEINGQRLGEKPPIRDYRVPADSPVTIKARNPFSGTYAEETFVLGDNQKKTIEMILKIDERNQKK